MVSKNDRHCVVVLGLYLYKLCNAESFVQVFKMTNILQIV